MFNHNHCWLFLRETELSTYSRTDSHVAISVQVKPSVDKKRKFLYHHWSAKKSSILRSRYFEGESHVELLGFPQPRHVFLVVVGGIVGGVKADVQVAFAGLDNIRLEHLDRLAVSLAMDFFVSSVSFVFILDATVLILSSQQCGSKITRPGNTDERA